jgi:tetratricopeptide (TPR) repeat protein
MTSSMKHSEMERLLASDTRYALVWKHWWQSAADNDEVGIALSRAFAPVRSYGDVIIFERTSEPDHLTLGGIFRRMGRGEARDGDVEFLMDLARSHPREPLPLLLLAKVAIATGQHEHAATMIERAAGLDPHDAAGLEWLAAHALGSGRVEEAAALVKRARSIRDSPMLQRLDTRLPAESGSLDTGT